MSIVLKFYPNGEFSQGVDTSKSRKKRCDREPIKPTPISEECRDGYLQWIESDDINADIHLCVPGQQFSNMRGGIWTYLCKDFDGHHYAFECAEYVLADVLMNEPIGRMIARGELFPLVHQSVESSPTPSESRKKLDSMTKSMGRNIRNAVYILEQEAGKDNLSFLTLTLPNLSEVDLGKCCERWDYMVDQILKWLNKRLKKLSIPFQYVYATEIQLKRLQSRHEYAPHIHIIFRGRIGKKHSWAITPLRVRKAWASIISNVVLHRQFETSALENLQRIRYSAARYLSKYLSKGACSIPGESSENPIARLHTQWGGMARSLSRKIKLYTTRISVCSNLYGLGISILQRMDELVDIGLVTYFKRGFIPISVCPVTGVERVLKVGSGCLNTPSLQGGLIAVLEYIQQQPVLQ